jgi:hypothetical protein
MHLKKKREQKSLEKQDSLKLVPEIEAKKLELIIFHKTESQTTEFDKIFQDSYKLWPEDSDQ